MTISNTLYVQAKIQLVHRVAVGLHPGVHKELLVIRVDFCACSVFKACVSNSNFDILITPPSFFQIKQPSDYIKYKTLSIGIK